MRTMIILTLQDDMLLVKVKIARPPPSKNHRNRKVTFQGHPDSSSTKRRGHFFKALGHDERQIYCLFISDEGESVFLRNDTLGSGQ